uniref:STAS domain-containing protein n=1 Tax=Chrysotila carterae TaxID=13221 RepID=A0A6S9X590_CHRCT
MSSEAELMPGSPKQAYAKLIESSSVESPSHSPRQRALNTALGGALSAMTVVVLNVLAASAIFHQGYAYAAYVGHGMVISMLVAAVGPIVLLALSKLPVIYCADTFVAALFSDMAASILTKNPKAPWATLCASMALSTALMGVSEWLLGALQVGKVVQFVPTPVMTGYLASIGYILLDSCTKMVTGCGILNVTGLQASGKIDQLAVAFFIAVGLYQIHKCTKGQAVQPFLVPVALISGTIVYQLICSNSAPGSELDVYLSGWTLQFPKVDVTLLTLLTELDVTHVDLRICVVSSLFTTATAILPNAIGKLLVLSALEQRFDLDVEYDEELAKIGISHIAAAPAMIPAGPSVAAMQAAHDLGVRGKFPLYMSVACSLLMAVSGASVVGKVPTALLAAQLGVLSVQPLLIGELLKAWRQLKRAEFVLVLVHILLTAVLGMVYAVVLGLILTAAIFIAEYSQHSGVLQTATAELEKSTVWRSAGEQAVLHAHGASVFIVHLHGMIFFGSANSVVEEVRGHLRTLAELKLPLRCLVLDFGRCSALDSSAVAVLFQTTRHLDNSAKLICASANHNVLDMLERCRKDAFDHYRTLDLALEHCENLLLGDYYKPPAVNSPSGPGSPQTSFIKSDEDHKSPSRISIVIKPPSETKHAGSPPLSPSAAHHGHIHLPLNGLSPDCAPTCEPEACDTLSLAESDTLRHAWPVAAKTWTPGQLNAINPELRRRVRRRFVKSVSDVCGDAIGEELGELIDYMDLVLLPPSTVVYDEARPSKSAPCLYVIDSGYVVVTFDPFMQEELSARRRIGKMGSGALLGTSSFLTHWMGREQLMMPASAVTDTFSQVLCLPAARCALLEHSRPKLIFSLYRLLLRVSEAHVKRQVLSAAASDVFKVPIEPSTSLTRLLMASHVLKDDAADVGTRGQQGGGGSESGGGSGGGSGSGGGAGGGGATARRATDNRPTRSRAAAARIALSPFQNAVRTSLANRLNARLQPAPTLTQPTTPRGRLDDPMHRSLEAIAEDRQGFSAQSTLRPSTPWSLDGRFAPLQQSGTSADVASLDHAEHRMPVPTALSLDSFEWHQAAHLGRVGTNCHLPVDGIRSPPVIKQINQAEESSTLRDGELGAAGPESAVTQDVVLPSASLQNSTSQETATHEDPACAVTPRSQTPTARAPQSNAYARGKLITLSGLEDLSDSSDEGAD